MAGPTQSAAALVATAAQLEAIVTRPVAVLYGGRSAEREVSLVSGRAVLEAFDAAQAAGQRAPARVIPVEVDRRGRWSVGGEALAAHEALARLPDDVLVFFGLHGGEGEDGTLQAFLEVTGRPYTGSGPAASARCMDKRVTRALAAEVGLCVAPGLWLSHERWREEREPTLSAAWSRVGAREAVAKPNSGGSSVDTLQVHSEQELGAALDAIFEHGDDALVEGWVHGLEATVGVIGNRGGPLRALPVVEIRPRAGRFFDYEEKYSEQGALETCPPRELTREQIAVLEAHATAIYGTLGCEGYARVDFIVPAQGGPPVLLEVNTLPGFTPRSLLPQAAAVAGVGFAALCMELCALGLARLEP